MKKSIRAAALSALLLASPLLISVQGCTDLTEDPVSAITPENYFKSEGEVVAALAAVYAQMRATLWGYYNLSQISADEHIVPTRGQDWFDNGRWLELDRQLWSANSPAGLEDINAAWGDSFSGVVRANALIGAMENVTLAAKDSVIAEIRVLRAFYYYQLMDLFGGVPLVTDVELKTRPRNTRAEVFDFIVSELNAARENLPLTRPAGQHGRMTKGAADAILANMYLNAGVFTKDVGISPNSYNSCTQVQVGGVNACQAAVDAADRILNSGAYQLASNWRSNFTADNDASPELILIVKHLNATNQGLNFLYRALHYNQISPTPWNGFATIAEVYNAFDANDQRREIFLVGPQVNLDTGEPVTDRAGNPLVFTVEIGDATQAGEEEGARIAKWPSDPNHLNENHGNDVAYFRLAEMYLIKAEALLELGRASEALPLLNTLRERVFNPPQPLGTVNQDVILSERLFELTAEAKRRQDMIRHGRFLMPWFNKGQREAHRVLMPIPQTQIDANPELTQNAGY